MEQVDKPAVTAVAFLDFSDAKVSPEQILKLVRSQDFVVDAQLIKPDRNGILYDKYFFPLVVAKNQRVVIFWDSVYGALFKGIREKLDPRETQCCLPRIHGRF